MKLLFKLVVGIALLLGFAGISDAAFEPENLILTIYNPNDNEVGLDLGSVDALNTCLYYNSVFNHAGSFSLSDFGSNVNGWEDLSVGLYTAYTTQTDARLIFATSTYMPPDVNFVVWNPFYSASTGMHSIYASLDTDEDGKAIQAANGLHAYNYQMNQWAMTPGAMGGFNLDPADADISLAPLATVGYVDLYLYEFSLVDNYFEGDGLVPGQLYDYQGIIRIEADGGIYPNPIWEPEPIYGPPIPIPGAVWLFGSGLLGLLGFRKRVLN